MQAVYAHAYYVHVQYVPLPAAVTEVEVSTLMHFLRQNSLSRGVVH